VWAGPKKHVLDEGQGRTNPFTAAMGDRTAMRPFVKILCPLVIVIIHAALTGGRSHCIPVKVFPDTGSVMEEGVGKSGSSHSIPLAFASSAAPPFPSGRPASSPGAVSL